MGAGSDFPKCEIVTIGSELLLGQIMDTNTTYLAKELGRVGISICFRTAVGDQLEQIENVIRRAAERCDIVISTGGLGPTLDDLTRDAVSMAVGVDLEFRQELMDQVERFFRLSNYLMPENNRRQAFVPAGSKIIPNPVGTAPGFIAELEGSPIICLPGVPRELKYLLSREVLPWLRNRFRLSGHKITYKVLKVVGVGESEVDRLIGDLMGAGKNPEVGLLASTGEIKIRITANARDEFEAQDLIRPIEEEIRLRLGKKIFGEDEDTLEGITDTLLIQRNLTLAVFETFSGGLLAHRLHRLPSYRLIESRVIPDKSHVIQYLAPGGIELERGTAFILAKKVRDLVDADVGLAVLGFPEKKEDRYILKGYAGVTGDGMNKSYSWRMRGELTTLQQRGAVIGLNTLRLALLGAKD